MDAASLWAYSGDMDQHREYCVRMAQQFADSEIANDVERTVKVSLLLDHEPILDNALLTRFLDTVTATQERGLLKWFLSAKALLACRRGDFASGHQSVEQALQFLQEDHETDGSMPSLMARSVQALILARQGETARARSALDELKVLMAGEAHLSWQEDGKLNGSTLLNDGRVEHDWLIPEILRREAEGLLSKTTEPKP